MINEMSLGDRMKVFYEYRTQTFLPRRTYTIIRLDGKAFHTYTRSLGLDIPFDKKFASDLNETAIFLCKEIQGAEFAFAYSDEISILLTDFKNRDTDAWFNGNVQKITSVSSSFATAKFNELRPGKLAFFDSRVFIIPNPVEVENYFIWRQKDCVRNSIQSSAQALYSHKELNCKSQDELQEMIFQKGHNWDAYDTGFKRGRLIKKERKFEKELYKTHWKSSPAHDFVKERLLYRPGSILPY